MNWKVLEHVPLLLYILAAKTLILCLAFAGAKVYQRKKLEAKRQKLEAEKKQQSEKKGSHVENLREGMLVDACIALSPECDRRQGNCRS
ncbi:PREDICTED: small integral membrane protein 11 [Lipotes vexillifer]|uniref:Small integral membrane protein 11 n=1 Tax=Lipotes vexillifer TaxID=118797 RepID=A0A340WDA8_LIPVE|nr:PREDICTED: small integral membrane protein 11 [Lipotes vexillifer]